MAEGLAGGRRRRVLGGGLRGRGERRGHRPHSSTHGPAINGWLACGVLCHPPPLRLRRPTSDRSTSPASWTATDAGPPGAVCPAPTGTPRARRTWPGSCGSPFAATSAISPCSGSRRRTGAARARGPAHHGPPREAVRTGGRTERVERADPVDRPAVRLARGQDPRYVQRAIRKAIADTSKNTGMVLTVAFDYGGRAELSTAVEAARGSDGGVTTGVHRRPPLPAGVSAGRRPGAHERRASGVELPALAVRRRGDLLHRRPVAGLRRRRTRRRPRPA